MRSSCVPHAFDSSRSGRDACRQKVLPTVTTKRAVRGAQRRNRTTSNVPSQCARPSARVRSAVHVRVELAAASLGALAAKAVGSSFYLMTLIRDSRASALLPFHEFPFFSNSLSNSFIAVFQVWAFALFRRTDFCQGGWAVPPPLAPAGTLPPTLLQPARRAFPPSHPPSCKWEVGQMAALRYFFHPPTHSV